MCKNRVKKENYQIIIINIYLYWYKSTNNNKLYIPNILIGDEAAEKSIPEASKRSIIMGEVCTTRLMAV